MTKDQIREAVLRALAKVAPEADPATLNPAQPLREQLDIDSMDFLNFVIAMHKSLGVNISEKDYPKLATLAGCVDYVSEALAVPS